jgi:hypothetical protein
LHCAVRLCGSLKACVATTPNMLGRALQPVQSLVQLSRSGAVIQAGNDASQSSHSAKLASNLSGQPHLCAVAFQHNRCEPSICITTARHARIVFGVKVCIAHEALAETTRLQKHDQNTRIRKLTLETSYPCRSKQFCSLTSAVLRHGACKACTSLP